MRKQSLVTVFVVCTFWCELNFGDGGAINSAVRAAKGLPYGPKPSNRNACAYSGNCYSSTQSGSRSLSSLEASAFVNLLSGLEFNTPPKISTICKSESGINGITIRCQCNGNNSDCHITEIVMQDIGLTGIISNSISSFANLSIIDLSGNKLHGNIPDSLGNLSSLRILDLSSNQLTGPIPQSLGNLLNLTGLYLSGNFLNGSIPSSLGALSNLKYLSLIKNFLSGPIPNDLGNLSNLAYLYLEENQLSGSIPPGLGKLGNLTRITLASNKLNGEIPEKLSKLTELVTFDISGNSMSGNIPVFITLWPSLTDLRLLGNNFGGKVPLKELFMLSNLNSLWISDVKNSGLQFPKIANLTSLMSLILRNCSLTGQIPEYFNQMPWLDKLDLSFNNLSGGISQSMRNLSLSNMNLARNMLNGKIPTWVLKNEGSTVDISYNNFDEKFSANSTSLMNTFACCQPQTDALNSSATNMSTGNMFSPSQYCPHRKPKYHSLFINCGDENTTIGGNYYDGDSETSNSHYSPDGRWAYSCSGDFWTSTASDYIKNMTCGASVPDAPLYQKARLCPLSLTYYGLCLRKGNYNVTLHFAEIVYTGDDDFSRLGKRVFDVYVQGELRFKDYNIKDQAGGPNKVTTENVTAYVDDNSLLVIHLFWAGKGSLYNPLQLHGPLLSAISVTPEFKVGGDQLSPLYIALITVASIVVALLILLAIIWKMCFLGNRELYEKHVDIQGRSVTVRQLIDATQNFSPKMEIGRGGFGIVYKAEFKDQTVAVKKLSAHSKQGLEEFRNEVFSLKSLRHENLVQLLDGFSGHDLHLLIYEYMDHNSIAHALFNPESSLKLDWETRHSICLGIAKGLKYLHQDSRLKIAHRDIKTNNILLDKQLNAKISDFGLARLYEEGSQNVVTNVGGTHGYMAPEYAMRGVIDDKIDVYSFGVVLLEIVSGKNNAEYKPKQETVFLLDTAYVLHKKGRLMSLVDKSMSKYDREQVHTILKLAMMCTSQSPTLRPTMSEIVSVLEGHQTIEQVSSTRVLGPGEDDDRTTAHMERTSTDFSSTSTETSNVSSYYILKTKDEPKNVSADPKDEISNASDISLQES